MILYLDASALVKRYVREAGSDDVGQLLAQAEIIGTSLITRAEVAAALARAARMGLVERDEAEAALLVFRAEWPRLARVQLTEPLIGRADAVAWDYGLRGYDAVHLASAIYWQESLHQAVMLATYDRELWHAGEAAGLSVWPPTF